MADSKVLPYETGDVVGFTANDFPSRLTQIGNAFTRFFIPGKEIKFTHIGVMYDEDDVDEAIGEGVRVNKLSKYKPEHYRVIRYEKGLTDVQKAIMKTWLEQQYGKKYNWSQLYVVAALKVVRLEWLWNPAVKNDQYICSYLVARSYQKIGLPFKYRVDSPTNLDPQDIMDAHNFIKVGGEA